jgi:hypothetical protein
MIKGYKYTPKNFATLPMLEDAAKAAGLSKNAKFRRMANFCLFNSYGIKKYGPFDKGSMVDTDNSCYPTIHSADEMLEKIAEFANPIVKPVTVALNSKYSAVIDLIKDEVVVKVGCQSFEPAAILKLAYKVKMFQKSLK